MIVTHFMRYPSRMKRFTAAVILFSLGIYLFVIGSQEAPPPDDVIRVFVSIPSQKFFEPLPSQITGLSTADLFLQVGTITTG